MTSHILTHEDGRKATWFELFFDLVFVVAVAALAGALSHHYDWMGLLEFGFLFLVLWWLWLGHTFHASRFDKDRPDQWAIGFAQILAVVFIAYGAGDAFGARAWAFAGGVAAFKALLMLGYLRESAAGSLPPVHDLHGDLRPAGSPLGRINLGRTDASHRALGPRIGA